jgi:Ca-activated chloride channel family protein
MNKRFTFLIHVLPPLLFLSCMQVSGKLLVMEANFRSSRGRYTEAISSYLKALEYGEAAPYAEYGLGSVFYSLDEGRAALERFAASQKILETLPLDGNRELRYRVHYNTGVVFFGEENFSAAAAAFREALRSDPSRIEAKRNLELSLRSLARKNTSGARMEQGREKNESRTALFDYVRQKEQNQWKSRAWAEEEPIAGPDY